MPSEKPKKLVEELKKHGEAYGLVVVAGTVALIGPPDLRSIPLMYSESDLAEAEKDGLIRKTTWTISNHTGKAWNVEVYVCPVPS